MGLRMQNNTTEKLMEKIKSFYPPVCVQGPVSGRWYIVGNGLWREVSRQYKWEELQSLWVKDESYSTPKPIVRTYETYHSVGSTGEIYEVKCDDGFWTCTCPAHAFGRGKDCKHIVKSKKK